MKDTKEILNNIPGMLSDVVERVGKLEESRTDWENYRNVEKQGKWVSCSCCEDLQKTTRGGHCSDCGATWGILDEPKQGGCEISDVSSRTCERGTKGCIVEHEPDEPKEEPFEAEKAAIKYCEQYGYERDTKEYEIAATSFSIGFRYKTTTTKPDEPKPLIRDNVDPKYKDLKYDVPIDEQIPDEPKRVECWVNVYPRSFPTSAAWASKELAEENAYPEMIRTVHLVEQPTEREFRKRLESATSPMLYAGVPRLTIPAILAVSKAMNMLKEDEHLRALTEG